ncbi:unnamed protein product [Meloidogyne enterolobii]|uniref:Uncharacterized protein n=1 Tax=Meloidogyne enterolobii TaxID=390850 RepID=A0ACB1B3J0_MELEN
MCYNKVLEPELLKKEELEEENIFNEEELMDLGQEEVRFIRYDEWHLEDWEEYANMETDEEEEEGLGRGREETWRNVDWGDKQEIEKKEEKNEEGKEESEKVIEEEEEPLVNIFSNWTEVFEEDWVEEMEVDRIDEIGKEVLEK